MMSKFSFHSTDFDIEVAAELRCEPLGGHPNQADLRQSLDKLISALSNWDDVEVTIKKWSLCGGVDTDATETPNEQT